MLTIYVRKDDSNDGTACTYFLVTSEKVCTLYSDDMDGGWILGPYSDLDDLQFTMVQSHKTLIQQPLSSFTPEFQTTVYELLLSL